VSLSLDDIAAVTAEIAPVLTGSRIQKVFQPAPHAITLECRGPGQTLSLFMSADPETARLHVLSHRLPNPATPPAFCQSLRAYIQGARIEEIEQVPGDRVVRIRIAARTGPCTLIAALTGRKADVLLLDGADRILMTLHQGREQTGLPCSLPSRPLAARTPRAPRAVSPLATQPDTGHLLPISHSIEVRYQQREEDRAQDQLKQSRLVELRKAIKKLSRRTDALGADLKMAAQYRDYARYGELLKANLGTIQKGQDEVTVVDYFDPAMPELVIPLDASKSPQGNLNDYFKKHQKHVAAEREIRPRLETAERELHALRAELTAIQSGEWEPVRSEPTSTPRTPPSHKPSAVGHRPSARSGPFRRFTSVDGLPIYVGRNARENEELTLKFAKSDDLWLHAQGMPGSHVVVRLEKGADPPPETIKDAATLALLYSDLKKSGKGEVIYTRSKYVRKAKGQPPGTVTVTQEKAIFVTLDRTRLTALKERSG
jgi:predicted ribosome quality control (RQC) complex YloA/Tae2 family protein